MENDLTGFKKRTKRKFVLNWKVWLISFDLFPFRYVLDNGQFFQEAGKLNENGAQEVSGSYSFQSADGETHWVTYTADEEGFHPTVGAGPGGPEAIDPNALKSLVG